MDMNYYLAFLYHDYFPLYIHLYFLECQNIYDALIERIYDFFNLETLIYDEETADGNVTFCLKNVETGAISQEITEVYKLDRTVPTGTVTMTDLSTPLKEIINKLKKDNVSIISTSLENGTELKKVNLDEVNKYGIILGNEGNGVRKDIQELATFNVRIEMDKRLESLNVGVAGAILMYYMMK